ncbi:MAG: glycosyltransferase family 39 protein [Bacteroidetes bacterium]|nr:glycosyltransferase family 39 protein [Bacteroidota bacterium]
MKNHSLLWIVLFLIGAGLRFVDLRHPVDRESWREGDMAAVARNFDREGMNILYPRIDWRGEGPGYAEMEFPVYPWLIALSYKIFGQNDIAGRLLSYLFSLLSIILFFLMSRRWLPPPGSYMAGLFFVFSPLIIQISNAIQPEPLMLLLDLIAVYAFVLWIEKNRWKYFVMAAIATSLALLVKINNAYLGLLFLFILFDRQKMKMLSDYRIYLFGLIALLPPVLWYSFANDFWITYGNSLGLSNEYHWIGLDFFTKSYFIKGIVLNELYFVIMPSAFLVILYALVFSKWKENQVLRYGIFWFGAVYIYYIITCRTTADKWSMYYHCISVPPAALLFGFGLNVILKTEKFRHIFQLLFTAILLSIVLVLANHFGLFSNRSNTLAEILILFGFVSLFLVCFILWKKVRSKGLSFITLGKYNLPSLIAMVFVMVTLFYQALKIRSQFQLNIPSVYYSCSDDIASIIPKKSLIIASGGPLEDFTGYPVAYNASYFFYWLDRKGFNIPIEEQRLEKIKEFKTKGADFFVAEEKIIKDAGDFEQDLKKQYELLYSCNGVLVFDLRSDK